MIVDGESYLMMDRETRFSKSLMEEFLGFETSKHIFEFCKIQNLLKLTNSEISVLLPAILTCPSKLFVVVF